LVPAGLTQRVADELRAESRTADADHEEVLEFAARAGDCAGMDFGREVVDRGERAGDLSRDFPGGSQVRGPQPVVADHAVLVGIGDGALFERSHVGERLFHRHFDFREKAVGERHAADIERHAERGVVVIELFETGPGHDGEEAGRGKTRGSTIFSLPPGVDACSIAAWYT